ncbi:hypothetical protein, partial [Candidatus Mycobacterium methanotrophicum]
CEARRRVLKIQTKLHRWARDAPHRRFDDLFNLVADPAALIPPTYGPGSTTRQARWPAVWGLPESLAKASTFAVHAIPGADGCRGDLIAS